jgi:hypothetical protein
MSPKSDEADINTTMLGAPRVSNDGLATDHDTAGLESAEDDDLSSSKRRLETESSSSRLESLRSELRFQLLLSMPDLLTLRSLVHASPTMHAQYRYNRHAILCACLDRESDGFFVDTYANLKSRVRELGSPRTDEMITGFLDSYRSWLCGSIPLPDMNSISPNCVRWMAAYQISVAQPLVRLYSNWALANLGKAAGDEDAADVPMSNHSHGTKRSRSEEIRISRALYRYGTFYHLFGRNKGARIGGFRHHEINEIFLCFFDPWEAEAVGCIDRFVRQRYEDIFNEVRNDLSDTNPRFRQENGLINPVGSFNLVGEHDGKPDCVTFIATL